MTPINLFCFCLFCVYPYEYIDDWEKLYETSLPEREEVQNNLNMEDITDADYSQFPISCLTPRLLLIFRNFSTQDILKRGLFLTATGALKL